MPRWDYVDDVDRIRKNSEIDAAGCWLWKLTITPNGYGRVMLRDGRRAAAHRLAYELLVGPVPDGLVLDHLCRVRRCVNPEHLEPVTTQENTRRGLLGEMRPKVCPHGHPYDDENTYVARNGTTRNCRACKNGRERALRRARIERLAQAARQPVA